MDPLTDAWSDATAKRTRLGRIRIRHARLDVNDGQGNAGWTTSRKARSVVAFLACAAWQVMRVVLCAVLVLFEPLLRVVLVPLAFLGFLVTLVFGFAMGAPNFPKWGMLAFSVGALLLYWAYLGTMSVFMRLPGDHR